MKKNNAEMRKNFRFNNTGNAFLLAFAAYYAVSIVYELVFTFVFGESANWPQAAVWCNYLLNPIVFIGVMCAYARKKNVDVVSAAKLRGKITFKQVGILALLSIFCIMAFLPISNIFLDLLGRMGFNMSLSFADTSASWGAYFLGLLLLAVLPALSEEFLMRGVVLNAAEQKRDFSYAILITAAMFSLMHGNPIQTVHQFLLGMVLAYVVLVSRSIWAGVLLHFFNNFLSLSLDYPINWFFRVTGAENMADGYWYIIWIVAIVLGGTMVVYLLKKFTNVSRDKKIFYDEKIIDVYENDEGVFTADGGKKSKRKAKKNDFEQAFLAIFSVFKRGGIKNAYRKINQTVSELAPVDDEQVEMTREDFFPSNIKLTFIILIVLWILSLVSGFLL